MLNVIHAFCLLTLISAKDYYSHCTDEKDKIHRQCSLTNTKEVAGSKFKPMSVRLQSLQNHRHEGYKSMVFSFSFSPYPHLFLREREYYAQELGYLRFTCENFMTTLFS